MDDFGEVCYFVIKYIDKFEIAYKVGLGGIKPQIWFIPDIGQIAEADELTHIRNDKKSDSIFQNLKQHGIRKLA